jgi:hypothetical protein
VVREWDIERVGCLVRNGKCRVEELKNCVSIENRKLVGVCGVRDGVN